MNETNLSQQEFDEQSVVVERAIPEDAQAIMRIKRDGWMDTYVNQEHAITIDDMRKKFSEEDLATGIEKWQKGIAGEVQNTNRATFVARKDDKVVGFTSPVIMEDGKRRIGALYVDANVQGLGIGGKLLRRALKWHGNNEDVYVYVVSYNDNALGFYERFGFKKTGTEMQEQFDKRQGIKLLPEIEMVRKAISN